MFISEKNKKELLKKLILYIGITAFIALFGIIYEQFSHNVNSLHMWFAWAWVLGFGVVPYLILYLLPIKYVPGLITESVYNFGVAMLTTRSIFIGVIEIYGTTHEKMILVYSILSIIFIVVGVVMYITFLLIKRITSQE